MGGSKIPGILVKTPKAVTKIKPVRTNVEEIKYQEQDAEEEDI